MARKGIPQIKIPLKPQNLTIEAIEPYLDSVIYPQFVQNAQQIKKYYDKYCLDLPILNKQREHDDSDVNNKVIVPTLKACIDWKVGYEVGNPIKYAQGKSSETDDMHYLNKYVRNSCKRTVDKEVTTWAFATGVGYYFIEPKSEDFDINDEAPFELYCREADTCTKVYSSYGGNKPLFDILYTKIQEIDQVGQKRTYDIFDIYLPNALYTYKRPTFETSRFVRAQVQPRGLYTRLPLVEKRPNAEGIGIVALAEDLQDSLDKTTSNGLDNIEAFVNEVIVYENVILGETADEQANAHRQMMKNGAIQVITKDPQLPAKVDKIKKELGLSDMMKLLEVLNSFFHAVVGVPMEMSGTNSGGTTKQGSEVANGYDNAYNRALDDINYFIKADTELLDRIMWICKQTPNNRLNEIATSDIEIMYCINLSDNILTKAQAYSTLAQFIPPDMLLRMCRMSNDPETDGQSILMYMRENEQRQQAEKTETIDVKEN